MVRSRQGGGLLSSRVFSDRSVSQNLWAIPSFYEHHLRLQIKCWHPLLFEILNYQYLMVYCAAFFDFYSFYYSALCPAIQS